MNSLFRCISAETLKLRRTLALALTVLAPLIITLVVFAMYAQYSDYYMETAGVNPWKQLCDMSLVYWNLIMMPLFITLESGLLTNMEHSRKNWKLIYPTPNPRRAIYAAKQIIGMALCALSMVFMMALILLLGNVLQGFMPEFGFDAPVPWGEMLSIAGLSYLASWFLISIHLWISMRSSSFVLSMAVGVTAMVLAIFIFGQDLASYYPWTLPGMVALNGTKAQSILAPLTLGVVGGIGMAIFGGWDVTRRDIE